MKHNMMLERCYDDKVKYDAGVDEAGRGCLAGSVYAAAVILPKDFADPLLDDSKKLSRKKREHLATVIEREALAYSVAQTTHTEIDQINILNASILAMHRSLDQLKIIPEHISVDGNAFKQWKNVPHHCIIKGDGKYMNIAAASILAKVYRDSAMETLHQQYPDYGWNSNKGYPTLKHRQTIMKIGITDVHRKSFAGVVSKKST